jgi:hypothetical protein
MNEVDVNFHALHGSSVSFRLTSFEILKSTISFRERVCSPAIVQKLLA